MVVNVARLARARRRGISDYVRAATWLRTDGYVNAETRISFDGPPLATVAVVDEVRVEMAFSQGLIHAGGSAGGAGSPARIGVPDAVFTPGAGGDVRETLIEIGRMSLGDAERLARAAAAELGPACEDDPGLALLWKAIKRAKAVQQLQPGGDVYACDAAPDIAAGNNEVAQWGVVRLTEGERFGRDYYLRVDGSGWEIAAMMGVPFPERLRQAVFLIVQSHKIDSRRLILNMAEGLVAKLRAERDWQDVPGCFAGERAIRGAFFGVPVREQFNNIGALITLDGASIGQIVAGEPITGAQHF